MHSVCLVIIYSVCASWPILLLTYISSPHDTDKFCNVYKIEYSCVPGFGIHHSVFNGIFGNHVTPWEDEGKAKASQRVKKMGVVEYNWNQDYPAGNQNETGILFPVNRNWKTESLPVYSKIISRCNRNMNRFLQI